MEKFIKKLLMKCQQKYLKGSLEKNPKKNPRKNEATITGGTSSDIIKQIPRGMSGEVLT